MASPITLYALSSCEFCQKAKDYFEEHHVEFNTIYVDRLVGEPYNDAMHVLRKFAMDPAFPTVVVGQKGVVGFHPEQLDALVAEAGA